MPSAIERDGADSSLLVAAVIRSGVLAITAFQPRVALGFGDKFFRRAQLKAFLDGKAFRAFTNEHHMRAIFEDLAREADGIANSTQCSDRTGA